MSASRLFVYLILNAVVAASTTLGVLWMWDRTHTSVPLPVRVVEGGEATQAIEMVLVATEVLQPAAPDEPAPAVTPTVYIVKAGDTLGRIAVQFDVSLEELMAANNLANPNVLQVGQTLLIPVTGFDPPTAVPATAGPAATSEPPRPTATRDPSVAPPSLTVREVVGAGNLATEKLVIVNTGGPVDLQGWSLRDGTGFLYTFPSLMLFEGGAISVHTTSGTTTVTDLYWGQSTAVWSSGKSVLLSDAGGTLHTRYTVP
jgi:LysM repeat protein